MTKCSVRDCTKEINRHGSLLVKWKQGQGLCVKHYARFQKYNDPLYENGTRPGAATEFLAKAIRYKGKKCLIWPFASTNGYPRIGNKQVTRLVCEAVNGPPPSLRHMAAHSRKCSSPMCVAPVHLRWATPEENCIDTVKQQRVRSQTTTPKAVREMRRLHEKEGIGLLRLAKQFGLSVVHTSRILKRESWKWL